MSIRSLVLVSDNISPPSYRLKHPSIPFVLLRIEPLKNHSFYQSTICTNIYLLLRCINVLVCHHLLAIEFSHGQSLVFVQGCSLKFQSHPVQLDQVFKIVLFPEPFTGHLELFVPSNSPCDACLVASAAAAAKFAPEATKYEPEVASTSYMLALIDIVFELLLLLRLLISYHVPIKRHSALLFSFELTFVYPLTIKRSCQSFRLHVVLKRSEQVIEKADDSERKASKV